MWRNITVFGAIVVVGCANYGCNEGEVDHPIYFHDLGEIFVSEPTGRTLSHTFEISNPSAHHTMRPEVYKSSCGCVFTQIRGKEVAPGIKTKVTVQFDVGLARRTTRESVFINTGLIDPDILELRVAAEVYPRVVFSAHTQWRFNVKPGKTRDVAAECVGYRRKNDPVTPIKVVSDREGITIHSLEEEERLLPEGAWEQVVRFKIRIGLEGQQELAGRSFQGMVTAIRGGNRYSENLEWTVEPYIDVDPPKVFVHANHADDRRYRVTVSAKSAFRIQSIEAQHDFVNATTKVGQTSDRHVLVFEVDGKTEKKQQVSKSVVLFKTDHPQQPIIEVPLLVLWPTAISSVNGRKIN